jgi:hypothetical protein
LEFNKCGCRSFWSKKNVKEEKDTDVAKLFNILSQEVEKSEESLTRDLLVKIVVVIEEKIVYRSSRT